MDAKKDLAYEITATYWGDEKAQQARNEFTQRFSKKELPDDLQEHLLQVDSAGQVNISKYLVP